MDPLNIQEYDGGFVNLIGDEAHGVKLIDGEWIATGESWEFVDVSGTNLRTPTR